jgi:hypothetical protein
VEKNKSDISKRLAAKIYGGLNMNWLTVILFAVGAAILTAVCLIVPVFKDTSFERMGVTLEAWIFFAVLIMANCNNPLDSALKSFVFFLISQPLIYLFQVPFSDMGWSLFGYYKNWFIRTLFTFPAAFVGWYIKKKNWISLLILAPILYILTSDYIGAFGDAFRHFPHLIVTALFCLIQVLIYLYTFTDNIWQKIVGFAVPLIAVIIVLAIRPSVDVNGTLFLPDNPNLTDSAFIVMDETSSAEVSIESTGEDSMIRVKAAEIGSFDFTIRDGETEYFYTVTIFEDESSHTQVKVEKR